MIQGEIRTITPEISALDSTIKTHDSFCSSLYRQGRHLGNEIRELGNQQVVWESGMKMGNERLAKLKDEWTEWRSRLVQAMPKITTSLPTNPVAELSADTLMDLQSEAIVASVVQEVSADTQAFTEVPSILVAEPLLGTEREDESWKPSKCKFESLRKIKNGEEESCGLALSLSLHHYPNNSTQRSNTSANSVNEPIFSSYSEKHSVNLDLSIALCSQ
ncbi:hypothetical protein RND71_002415 [Anisodus tanguticus]|uniref:Uncharacterized protein n=1 Tax=Anisodus tanguticus TaxID=243964 RepID=A0AAE1T2Y2_9SOLA|nr:hypothetical protein RND71_002415 [Anisodus tanguticus]